MEAGFKGIIKSVTRRKNMVTQYIATRPILDICERVTRRPGARVSLWWWEQAGIDLDGAKKRTMEAATVSELDSESDSELDSESNAESNAEPGGEEESRGASGSSRAEWSGAEE